MIGVRGVIEFLFEPIPYLLYILVGLIVLAVIARIVIDYWTNRW